MRCRWGAASAALAAGERSGHLARLRSLEQDASRLGIVWLARRVAAALRLAGERPCTRDVAHTTETDVMIRVARGQTSTMIAHALGVKPATVETHVRNAMRRTGTNTRLQAAYRAVALQHPPSARFAAERTDDGGLTVRSTLAPTPRRQVPLHDVPDTPWSMASIVVTGTLRTEEQVAIAVLAVVRGAAIELDVAARTPIVAASLLDELRRIGEVETRLKAGDGGGAVDDIDLRLVELVAAGTTITDAATALGYSRRALQRRLAVLRQRTGVTTNAEAVIALAGGSPAERETRPGVAD
jgi:DNA-binding NarL/FixJ family response regulator